MEEFSWDEYYSRGEKMYKDFATNAPVYDERHPSTPMFDESGDYSKDYLNVSNMTLQSSGNMKARDAHFQREKGKLLNYLPKEERSVAMLSELRYGGEPRYQKSEDGSYALKSPYLM